MRKIDKKLNISKLNLLSEQRYLDEKNGLEEGWKSNMAAGVASLGFGMGAQAQQAPQQAQGIEKTIQATPTSQNDAKVDKSSFFGQTKPIFHIQTGVQDGKTGKSSVYVYHKDPKDPSFDVAKDRETVYTQNLDNLQKTQQYQDYMKRMHDKQVKGVAVNESKKLELLETFNDLLKRII